ncbi:hypothetical protein DYU05_04015 [Mucilaginibacter terrenus]|uniref:Uncharacterized protein n=1 Tax=Mucilaginibacter terrenus TaxID=2482727 RepID=A0A3E2NV40_9SPHI|nr:hypothetical protein DYU05_04015 [Mucilaginibacter terrenus]
MHTPPPPPAVHRPVPEINRPKAAENYPTERSSIRSTNLFRGLLSGLSRYIPDMPSSPIWFGKSSRGKHTNRLHSRKQAKKRAKRKGR